MNSVEEVVFHAFLHVPGSVSVCVYLGFHPIGLESLDFSISVTKARARRPGTAASVSRRRVSRRHTLAASQAGF